MAFGGEAVGHIDGKVIFVTGGVPGDVAHVAITEDKPGFSRGIIADLITPSPERAEPFCQYADRCGGCQWQHISYGSQVAWKQKIVAESLRRIGGFTETAIEDCIPSQSDRGYRTVARYFAKKTKSGIIFGYHEAQSHKIVDIKECPIASKKVNDIAAFIRTELEQAQPDAPDVTEITIRASHNHSSSIVSIVTADEYDFTKMAESMMAGIEGLAGVSIWHAAGRDRAVHVHTFGERWREEHAGGRSFRIDERSFFQVHTGQAERLIELIREMIGTGHDDVVVDAFGGVGLLSMGALDSTTPVRLFDTSRSAIRDSVENASENGFADFTAKVADARTAFSALKQAGTIIIDPPRAGLGKRVVESACSLGARDIVYISCNPTTLARDLKVFAGNGYKIERVVPVDMFPQTYHIETVVKLTYTV